jgi:hypothetical protein
MIIIIIIIVVEVTATCSDETFLTRTIATFEMAG